MASVSDIIRVRPEAAAGDFPVLPDLGLTWTTASHGPLLDRLSKGAGTDADLAQAEAYREVRYQCLEFAAMVLHDEVPWLTREMAYWSVVLDSYGPAGLSSLSFGGDTSAPNFFAWLNVPLDVDDAGVDRALNLLARVWRPGRTGRQWAGLMLGLAPGRWDGRQGLAAARLQVAACLRQGPGLALPLAALVAKEWLRLLAGVPRASGRRQFRRLLEGLSPPPGSPPRAPRRSSSTWVSEPRPRSTRPAGTSSGRQSWSASGST